MNTFSTHGLALILSLSITSSLVAQGSAGTITGRVVDAQTLQPIATAQVFLAGSEIGVLTGANGNYQISNAPAGLHTIRVQRIGFRSASSEVTVLPGQSAVLNFAMEREALALDAVIVTGTAGGSRRRAVGNVVERLEMSEVVQSRPVTSVEQVLTSATPGVTTLNSAGMPGGGQQIRIRGSSSAALPGNPIIYIDGIRMNGERGQVRRHSSLSRLNDIDPRDIQSIEVIKGPAAATLYGTEASNGVIQIITKRGVLGQPTFDASAEVGANWLPYKLLVQSWARHPTTREVGRVNLADLERQRGVEVFQKGLIQRYNLGVRGGNETLLYSASLSHNDQNGVTEWLGDTRDSGRASLGITATEALRINLNMAYSQGETSQAGADFFTREFGFGGNANAVLDPNEPVNRGFANPPDFFDRDVQEDLVGTTRTTMSLELRHDPAAWISHRLVAGMDDFRETQTFIVYQDADGIGQRLASAREGRRDVYNTHAPVRTVDFSGTLTFNPTERLNSATSYGVQYYNRQNWLTSARGDGFATATLSTLGATARTTASETFVENTTLGVYVQQQFGWEDRLFLTGAIRTDDNSAFGERFNAAIYPKLSATWVVHEEPFWNVDAIDQLRLRGAWGAAGQQPDAFAATTLFQPVSANGGLTALTPRTYGNPDLGPERGEELELGLDTELFDGRLALSFTGFWRKTKDAMVELPVAPSLGFTAHADGTTVLVNVGQISAWGTETALSGRLLEEDPVQWDFNLAFTTLGNRVDDLGGVARIPVQRGRSHVEGYPLASLVERKIVSAEFVSGNSGAVTNIMCDGGQGPDRIQMGGPPVPCDEAPRVYWGQAEPTRLASLTSTWTLFENWRLSAMLDYKGGHWESHDHMSARQSGYDSALNVFLADNPIATAYISAITWNGLNYRRGGFAKFRELSLGYALPTSLAERFGASRARVDLGATNLFTIWVEQSHIEREAINDPEMLRQDETFGGESGGGWPPMSQVLLRMNVSF